MEGTNEPTTKEILQEAVRTTEQTTEATKRSLMIVNDTKQVQAATMQTLKSQGDQMKRVAGTLQEVEQGVDEAEGVLDAMRCCGCFGGKAKAKAKARKTARVFAAQKDFNTSSKKSVENGHKDDKKEIRLQGPRPGTLGSAENGEHVEEYTTIQEHKETQEKYLDQISDALDVIKEGAKEMASEVETQNKLMGDLDNHTSHAQDRVDEVQRHRVVRKYARGLERRMK